MNTVAKQWAESNIREPIPIAPPSISPGMQKGAFIVLAVIMGGLGAIMIYGFFEQLSKYGKVNYMYGCMALVMFGFLFGLYYFTMGRNKEIIVEINRSGIKTRGGKHHLWEDLNKVYIHLASKIVTRGPNYDFVRFHFSSGKALASSFSPGINNVLWVAERVPCKKT
jgi:hypothetical protein